MVTPSKFGLSSLMNFQNAFSAKVLEAGCQHRLTRSGNGLTPVLVSTWCFSSLLLTDTGTVLVPVLLGEPVHQPNPYDAQETYV